MSGLGCGFIWFRGYRSHASILVRAMALLVTMVASIAAQARSCGQLLDHSAAGPDLAFEPKIVGGERVPPGGMIAMAALMLRGTGPAEGRLLCGATLLSQDYAMTAAHCIGHFDAAGAARVRLPGEVVLYVSRDRNIATAASAPSDDVNSSKLEVIELVCHPNYDGNPRRGDDIAIVKVRSAPDWAWRLPDGRRALSVPATAAADLAAVPFDSPATVAGWGRIAAGGAVSAQLLRVELGRRQPRDCLSSRDIVCLGNSAGGTDACNGDSGGFAGMVRPDGRLLQIGIVSSGAEFCGMQNRGAPLGSFTRVARHIEWIGGFVPEAIAVD